MKHPYRIFIKGLLMVAIMMEAGLSTITSSVTAASATTPKGDALYEMFTITRAELYPDTITVAINEIVPYFHQQPVSINNTIMVPMRTIFEKLGATITFDQKTQLVTAVKNNTVIKLTINNKIAYVNGKATSLAVKAQTINNTTMVPLRFVSEALGARVNWYPDILTASITGEAVEGGKPSYTYSYGNHNYGSAGFSQYVEVMKIIAAAKETYPQMKFDDGGDAESSYKAYLNGDRASNYEDRTLEARWLRFAEQDLGALVGNGVSAEEIEKAYKVGRIARKLLRGISNPGDASPRSAYDALVKRVSDCDSDANVLSAVFDSFGYNTAIIARIGHADMVVQIAGKWYTVFGGSSFNEISVTDLLSRNLYVYTNPTTGSFK